ncbi:MAG TPA: cation:proton antiporter [Candidatus Acidoferrum sp.]|nr:cation:proton antiporter [Candidatus Acidoferrum sp.]
MVSTLGPAAIPLSMLVVFISAKLMAELFERWNQPGIVGEILAGVLIGPSVLGWLRPNEFLGALSDLGAMFLLFRVGLEVKSSELLKVGGTAALVAVCGVIVPFVMGWATLLLWGQGQNEAIFVGAAMVATSVGITAQVLSAKGLLHAVSSRIILAAAVIDDVLGLLVLAVVSSVSRGKLDLLQLAITGLMAVAFTMIVARWGTPAMHRLMPSMERRLRLAEPQFAIAMALLFALSALAVWIGVAAIVGAFLAGMALAESTGPRVEHMSNGVAELLVPFFLAGIGLNLELTGLSDPRTVLLALTILVAAVVSKFVGCGLGALRLGKAEALRIGVGMIPRGEVGMVVAQIGLGLGIIQQNIYGVVVVMSVATTMLAPPLLKIAYRGVQPRADDEECFRMQ